MKLKTKKINAYKKKRRRVMEKEFNKVWLDLGFYNYKSEGEHFIKKRVVVFNSCHNK